MKLKLNKELKLTKASLAKLQENQIGHIKGGVCYLVVQALLVLVDIIPAVEV